MKPSGQPRDGLSGVITAIPTAKKTIDIAIFRCDSRDVQNPQSAPVKRGVKARALIANTNSGGEKRLRKLEQQLRCLVATVGLAASSSDALAQKAPSGSDQPGGGLVAEPPAIEKAVDQFEARTPEREEPKEGFSVTDGDMIAGAGFIALGPRLPQTNLQAESRAGGFGGTVPQALLCGSGGHRVSATR